MNKLNKQGEGSICYGDMVSVLLSKSEEELGIRVERELLTKASSADGGKKLVE